MKLSTCLSEVRDKDIKDNIEKHETDEQIMVLYLDILNQYL